MTGAASRGAPPAETAAAPVVAIVGRPNVGKSAVFNRMVRGRLALVEDIPGTTRDRLYGNVEWRGRLFRLVDTGGLDLEARTSLSAQVRQQVQAAVDEAQVILFVVDSSEGVTAGDLEVADTLRRTAKPVLMLANKAESKARQEGAVEFYELGLGEPLPVSAHHGTGLADVMDLLIDILPPAMAEEEAKALRIAIVGRPNVGKSMLLNAILGEERVIVSEVPGTTRDSIDTPFEYAGQRLVLVDTAGIRRRGHVEKGLEKHAVLHAQRAVERADVALLVLEALRGRNGPGLSHRRLRSGGLLRPGAGGQQVGPGRGRRREPPGVRASRPSAAPLRPPGRPFASSPPRSAQGFRPCWSRPSVPARSATIASRQRS